MSRRSGLRNYGQNAVFQRECAAIQFPDVFGMGYQKRGTGNDALHTAILGITWKFGLLTGRDTPARLAIVQLAAPDEDEHFVAGVYTFREMTQGVAFDGQNPLAFGKRKLSG